MKAATGVDLINVNRGDRYLYITGILIDKKDSTSDMNNARKNPNNT